MKFITLLHPAARILLIVTLAFIAHFIVRELRQLTQWAFAPKPKQGVSSKENFALRYPRIGSLITIFVSAMTFSIYFIAVGLIFKEFHISLTTYLASASVIGLAIGFGSQGLVQDVVIGLTLIFSDALNVEDLVEVSGQTGRVRSIGLRFTIIENLQGQEIYIPNRNIGMIGRFRKGHVQLYMDIQIPPGMDEDVVTREAEMVSKGIFHQHRSILLFEPELLGIKEAKAGNWRYLRVQFHIWPGQSSFLESNVKQRMIASMKNLYPDYADWMVNITYKSAYEK